MGKMSESIRYKINADMKWLIWLTPLGSGSVFFSFYKYISKNWSSCLKYIQRWPWILYLPNDNQHLDKKPTAPQSLYNSAWIGHIEPLVANLTLIRRYVQTQPSERCITVRVYEPEDSWTEQLKWLLPTWRRPRPELAACQSTVEQIMTPFKAEVN